MARTHSVAAAFDPLLRRVQCELFDLGAQLATPDPANERITATHVAALEGEIDRHEATLDPLTCFILPAGTPLAAAFHVARTVCRRAERRVVTLATQSDTTIPANAIEYLNRLGDLLFVLARVANRQAGVADDPWIHP
jgi:cob(I)alamin adenosyltransferase